MPDLWESSSTCRGELDRYITTTGALIAALSSFLPGGLVYLKEQLTTEGHYVLITKTAIAKSLGHMRQGWELEKMQQDAKPHKDKKAVWGEVKILKGSTRVCCL